MIEITIKNFKLRLVKGDITREKVDAIVNAANSGLMGGGGVDGAIHRAGGPMIQEECRTIVSQIGRLPAGKAVITTGGNLPAKFVIHTVGPVWHGGSYKEAEVLASCYFESLKLATSRGLTSIAFPAISTGAYGYPIQEAAEVAINAVRDYVLNNQASIEVVRLVLYDDFSYKVYTGEFSKIAKKEPVYNKDK
jgi:O-acetyl-ADP-ribose deacetylase (regulator of RNase III)